MLYNISPRSHSTETVMGSSACNAAGGKTRRGMNEHPKQYGTKKKEQRQSFPIHPCSFVRLRGMQARVSSNTPEIIVIFAESASFPYDGDGGSRTRVRKPFRATFSGCRPSFVFPAPVPGGQGTEVGSRLVHDGYKGKLAVHVRC